MKLYQLHISVFRQLLTVAIAVVSLASLPQSAFAVDEVADKQQPATVIHVGRNAAEVAQSIKSNFDEGDQLSIGVDQETNVLILKGNEKAVSRAASVLKVIDQPQKTVNVKVSIAVEDDSSTDNGGNQRVLDQLELATLSDNKARLQFGQQVAVPTGTTGFSGGRPPSRSYSQQQVGTLVQVEPRVTVHGIELQLEVEKSWLESNVPSGVAEPEANSVEQNTTFTTSLQTTLLLHDGESQTVRANVTSRTGDRRDVLITVSATTGKPAANIRAADIRQQASGRAASADSPSATPSTGGRSPQGSRSGSTRGGFGGRGASREGASGGRNVSPLEALGQANRSDESIRRMFVQIDSNRDEEIGQEEFDAHPFSRSIATRGFAFSEAMSFEQFKTEFLKFLDVVRGAPRD